MFPGFFRNSAKGSPRAHRQGQLMSPWVASLMIILASLVFQSSTWRSLFNIWMDDSRYSHGLLVAIICAYLIYRQKDKIDSANLSPEPRVLFLLAALVFTWLLASLSGVQIGHQVLLPLILLAALVAVTGWGVARNLLLPVSYLFFAIPIWDGGNEVLQLLTVKVVGGALHALNIPAWLEGNFVILPDGTFQVADGCSGIHFLIVAGALSVLYGYLWLHTNWHRFLLVMTAVVLALLANWLRVFVIVYAGHVSQMQHYLVQTEHYYWGWALFGVLMLFFFWVARWIEGKDVPRLQPAGNERKFSMKGAEYPSRRGAVVMTICFLLMGAGTALLVTQSAAGDDREVILKLPRGNGQWILSSVYDPDWKPLFIGPTAEDFQIYDSRDVEVAAYAALYLRQREGEELIGFENRIEGVGGWETTSAIASRIWLPGGLEWKVNELTMNSRGDARRIVYFWYEIGGIAVPGRLEAKLLQSLMRLKGSPEAGVMAISAKCESSCDDARFVLETWIEGMLVDGSSVRGPVALSTG